MKRYWQLREIYQLSAEEIHKLRLHLLFYEDTTNKLILPETSVYSGDATDDTLEHLGNVTKPLPLTLMTQKLPALKIKRKSNANKH